MNSEDKGYLPWIFGALASSCFVAITQLAVKPDLQWLDRRAMLQLAAALPLLIGSALIFRQRIPNRPLIKAIILIAAVAGPLLEFGGIFDLIRAVSLWACIAFGFAGAIMLWLVMAAEKGPD